jgi:adenylate cyclase
VAELIGLKQDASGEQTWLAEIFADAMLAYQAQDWVRASHNLSQILKAFPHDGPARFYLRHCQDYQETAPAGLWDGCIRLEGK